MHDYVLYWWPDFVTFLPPVRSILGVICIVSHNCIPAYYEYLLRILLMYGAVSHCSY